MTRHYSLVIATDEEDASAIVYGIEHLALGIRVEEILPDMTDSERIEAGLMEPYVPDYMTEGAR